MARKPTPPTRATKRSTAKPPVASSGAKPGPARSKSAARTVSTSVRAAATGTKPQTATKAPARTSRPEAAARTPVQNKQELRDRIEKLERANVNLRVKNRDATEAARLAANRADALEEELAELRNTSAATPAAEPARPARSRRARNAATGRDPGDAVPPGVAQMESQAPDEVAQTARRNLEHNLSAD